MLRCDVVVVFIRVRRLQNIWGYSSQSVPLNAAFLSLSLILASWGLKIHAKVVLGHEYLHS